MMRLMAIERRLRLGIVASHPIQYQSPLWRALDDKGLDVEVLYLSKHGLGTSVDTDFGQAVRWDSDLFSGFSHRFLNAPWDTKPGSVLTGLSGHVVPAILRGRYDAVLVSGYASAGYLAARLAAALGRVPVYVRAETVSSPTKTSAGSKAWRLRAHGVVLRPLLRSYAGAFPIGVDSERFYREMGIDGSLLTRAPYGVENKWFSRPPDAVIRAKRDEMGCAPQDVLILHAGKLIGRKRPEQAVAVAAALRSRGITARAVIVGSGPSESEVRTRMHSDDLFLGFANQTELPTLYGAADIVVVASTYETWGLVVNEALAAGTPVVSSPYVPAADEIAAECNVVRIVSTMDPDLWADECLKLLAVDRAALAAEAMSVVGRYDVDVAANAIVIRLEHDLS
jgi:glycosyltransferase involved in cell wall biosynthesis